MTTFDRILPSVEELLANYRELLALLDWLLVNRDLNGRVRLVVPECVETNESLRNQVAALAHELSDRMGPHGYEPVSAVLYDADEALACQEAAVYALEEFPNVRLADRLATEVNWAEIAPKSTGVPRIAFFSIKGGVGRSTALAASAWALAQAGKRVLVLDLDLESPGLSSSLLPPERLPGFGIADWLVEDLVDNGGAVFGELIATSPLSHDGEIYVVPAHGRDAGEYVSKLGRVWMPKIDAGSPEWRVMIESAFYRRYANEMPLLPLEKLHKKWI